MRRGIIRRIIGRGRGGISGITETQLEMRAGGNLGDGVYDVLLHSALLFSMACIAIYPGLPWLEMGIIWCRVAGPLTTSIRYTLL